MLPFKIKRRDLLPFIEVTIGNVDDNGDVVPGSVPLTGATVVFNMKDEAGNLVVDRGACVIDDDVNGDVHYEWVSGDTDVAGSYTAEFEATFAGKPMTFPNDSNIKVKIFDDLG